MNNFRVVDVSFAFFAFYGRRHDVHFQVVGFRFPKHRHFTRLSHRRRTVGIDTVVEVGCVIHERQDITFFFRLDVTDDWRRFDIFCVTTDYFNVSCQWFLAQRINIYSLTS